LGIVGRIKVAQQVVADHRLHDIIREDIIHRHPLGVSMLANAHRPHLEKAHNGGVA
jgi:hypothetical protein